jgi:hypothetical protein
VDTNVLEESSASIYKVDSVNPDDGGSRFPIHEDMKYHIPEGCNLVVFIFSYSL